MDYDTTISSVLSMVTQNDLYSYSHILLTCISTLLLFYFLRKRDESSKTIPVPWNFPLIGNVPWIVWSFYRSGTPLYEFMRQLKYIYGNVYAFNICGQLVVIVNEFQVIKKMFDSPYVSARPRLSDFCVQLGLQNGLVLASGDLWSQQRKFTQTAFRSFGIGMKSFEEKITSESHALITEITHLKGAVFESQPVLVNAVSNVICSVIFGKRFDYRDERFLHFQMLAGQQTVLGQKLFPEIFIPFLRYRNSKNKEAIVKNFHEIQVFLSDIIREHEIDFDPNHPRDYIDVYLNELQQKKDGRASNFTKLDEESMMHTISQLFSAGTDTTSGTLQWGLAYMVAYPNIQTRIQEEIDEVVGSNRLPTISDKPSLPYTCATIFEIQRLTRSRLAVPHFCSKSISVCGVTIPEDAIVMANIWAVHRDPELYSDPEVFKPERFLNEKGEVYQPEEFVPFSSGRRICLGDKLARMELFIFLSHLLHQFTFEPTEPTDYRESLDPGIGMDPKYPRLRAIKRD
ncbi:cytochrome P450 2J5-like [Amphiura filiformis]|uniref:cytochrome P450 2J5-like n=1 Tax=Amphiura filiformis TaxID=82378 RepID=UPI003B2223BD